MDGPELIKDVCGVEACIVAECLRDRLKCLGESFNENLFLSTYLFGFLGKDGSELHLNAPGAGDNVRGLERPSGYHEGIVEATFWFSDELLGASPEDQSGDVDIGEAGEEVEAFWANTTFLEELTGASNFFCDICNGRNESSTCAGLEAFHIGLLDTACGEDAAVREVLRC